MNMKFFYCTGQIYPMTAASGSRFASKSFSNRCHLYPALAVAGNSWYQWKTVVQCVRESATAGIHLKSGILTTFWSIHQNIRPKNGRSSILYFVIKMCSNALVWFWWLQRAARRKLLLSPSHSWNPFGLMSHSVSPVGTATDYGLDGPGSNPGWDEVFHRSGPALGPGPRL